MTTHTKTAAHHTNRRRHCLRCWRSGLTSSLRTHLHHTAWPASRAATITQQPSKTVITEYQTPYTIVARAANPRSIYRWR